MTTDERTEKLKGDYVDEQRIVALDQQPEVETAREPVNTEVSILQRLDRLETRDMNKARQDEQFEREWYLDRETRHIIDSDGKHVHQPRETSVLTPAQCEWWDRLLSEHNALVAARRIGR